MTSSDGGQLKMVSLHCDNRVENDEKSMKAETLAPYLELFEKRTLVLCKTEDSCSFTTVALCSKNVETCILNSNLFEKDPKIAKKELARFLKGDGRIGVTTFKLFSDGTVPLVENIVFFDYHDDITEFNTLITRIASESNVGHEVADVNVTCLVSNSMDYYTVKAVLMEQRLRGNKLPEWLKAKVRDMEKRRQSASANTTASSSASAPATTSSSEEYFEPRPLGDGTFLVPARCIMGHDDEDEDEDDFSPFMTEKHDERDYDYDGYFQRNSYNNEDI